MELVRAASDLTDDVGIDLGRRPRRRCAATTTRLRRARTRTSAAPVRSRGGQAPSTGPVFRPRSSTRPRTPSTGASRLWIEVTNAIVAVELSGAASAGGVAVRLRSGELSGAGVLNPMAGRASRLSMRNSGRSPETAAWGHDWRTTVVTVGAEVDESPQTRERIRAFVRSRLAEPAGDAFLAEILAAEGDY